MKSIFNSILVSLLIFSIVLSQPLGPVAAQNARTDKISKVPVIVLFVSKSSDNQQKEEVTSVEGEITHNFKVIKGVAALVPPAKIQELKKKKHVISVDQDVEVKALDATADQQILADHVLPLGFNGSGIRLAILDTGIATAHPEFAGRIIACETEVSGTTSCEDGNGHGTHVAGIAGAQGVNSAAKGVAPSVLFMIDKVLDNNGDGDISQVIAGIDWAVANKADIISMSLGTSPLDGGGTQPNCNNAFPSLTAAINNAVASGVTVVAAAGNSGTGGLGAPGCISNVIAAGAVNNHDVLADFSSVGAAMKDHGVVAPGVSIYSTWLSGRYATLSGTSMATPMVSGTVALMLSKNPDPTAVRGTLYATADCVLSPCPNTNVGYGRINALKAVNAILTANGYINGTVTDTLNNGIAGATVATNTNISVTANASGFYSLNLSSGAYILTASMDPVYYINNTIPPVTVTSGITIIQNIVLTKKPTGTISGKVMNT